MGRKKRGRPVHGVVLVDKPAGMTSNAVVQRVRRLFNAQKAGHTGTLDPFATGLLPVCLGEATKASAFQLDADKTYEASLKLGVRTDTGDSDGSPVETVPVPALTMAQVVDACRTLTGEIWQTPPLYSALKKDGRPLYDYARAGETVAVEPRRVVVHALEPLALEGDRLRFRVHCGKGTYVRALGEDLARALGTVGHLVELRRLETGGLSVDDALTLEAIEQAPDAALRPLEILLPHLPRHDADEAAARQLSHGNPIPWTSAESAPAVLVMHDGVPLCIGEVRQGRLWPKRRFNLATITEAS